MMNLTQEQMDRLKEAKKTRDTFLNQDLSILSNNYKFPTFKWINLIYLYIMGVEGKFTNLIGDGNKNTFINDFIELGDKIKEQVKLNLIDLLFDVGPEVPYQAQVLMQSANRKFHWDYNDEDFSFSENIDFVVEDAIDYGSGFLMLWRNKNGKLKNKHIDPMKLVWNQFDFKGGTKIMSEQRTLRSILNDDRFTDEGKEALKDEYINYEEHLEDVLLVSKVFTPISNKKDKFDIWILDKDILLFETETEMQTLWKFDAVKRRGFRDALGIGTYEKGFNILMGLKKNRERLERVMNILSKMAFFKKKEGTVQGDILIGKKFENLEDGVILSYDNYPIEPANLGGQEQFNVLVNQLAGLKEEATAKLTINEAIQGKTLPSGTSYALGNQQFEAASSVLKETQKNYGKWLRMLYKRVIIPYMLHMFDSKENLKKYISETDYKTLERHALDEMLVLLEIQHASDNQEIDKPFDPAIEKDKLKRQIKKKGFISKKLLEMLKERVKDIDLNVTGERKSRPQIQAFKTKIWEIYQSNPQIFKDPTFIKLAKENAKSDTGMTPDEIDALLKVEE